MLRASTHIAREDLDLRAVAHRDVDANLPAGNELLDFADALLDNDEAALDRARDVLRSVIGPVGAGRAAMVVGNFEMMNRLLDATGVPVPICMGGITSELGLPEFTGR